MAAKDNQLDVIFNAVGIKRANRRTKPCTFSEADVSSLLKDASDNRDNTGWPCGQHVVLTSTPSGNSIQTILTNWKNLTSKDADQPSTQRLYIPVGEGRYQRYDASSQPMGNPDMLQKILGAGVSGGQVGKFDKYLAAIRTKPFILLAGISGTGKSRLVRQLAQGCCPSGHELGKDKDGNADKAKKPGNFELIPVRPNWHDSTELMGYVTRLTDGNKPKYIIKPFVKFLVKAAIYKDVPFFLCLDEMNLAPVEQYFAEYLSIVETRKKENGEIVSDVLVDFNLPEIDVEETVKELMKAWWCLDENTNLQWLTPDAKAVYDKILEDKGIRLPRNFIVMGTVNMDETTCSFSRKVLDRAMTFELNEVDMEEGLAADNSLAYGSITPASSAFATDVEGIDFYTANKDKCDAVKKYLVAVNKLLDGTPFKFAYRSRNEIMLYCIERTKGGIVELPQALDEATSMKILSRIEGDEQKLQVPKRDGSGNIVKDREGRAEMMSLLDKDALPKVIADALKAANGGNEPNPPCTVCSEKLAFMAGRLESGFTNFFV